MARRRKRAKKTQPVRRLVLLLAAIPALYLVAALVGSLLPVNRGWSEPAEGITVYLASNGIHSDIIMPARTQGLDWEKVVPKRDFARPDPAAAWVAFGSGEEKVYLETPRWRDITLATIWSALTGGRRVMHVEWVSDPRRYADRQIRLRPEEYRRLWSAIHSDLQRGADGRPQRVNHPGYGRSDAFYWAGGRFSALSTCNTWAAGRLRIAGIETSLWPPFAQGLLWRHREVSQPH